MVYFISICYDPTAYDDFTREPWDDSLGANTFQMCTIFHVKSYTINALFKKKKKTTKLKTLNILCSICWCAFNF